MRYAAGPLFFLFDRGDLGRLRDDFLQRYPIHFPLFIRPKQETLYARLPT